MSAGWKTAALAAVLHVAFTPPAPAAEMLVTGLTDPEPVNPSATTDTASDSSPSIATDGQGSWVCVWQFTNEMGGPTGTDADIVVSRSTDGGATWTPPAPVNSDAATDGTTADTSPRIATDGAGAWVVVWVRSGDVSSPTGTDPEITFARSVDAGVTWTPPGILNSTADVDGGGSDVAPDLATDGNGHWICVWQSDASVLGAGFDRDIFYAVSTDDGVSWGPTAVLNSRAGVDGSKSDLDPRIATDGAGTWICTWRSADDLGGLIGVDYDILYAVSTNNGATWSPQAPVNHYAYWDDDRDISPSVAASPDGTWVIAWQSYYDLGGTIGGEGDILFAVSMDAGTSWSEARPLNANAAVDPIEGGFDNGVELLAQHDGEWLAVWLSHLVEGGLGGPDRDVVYATTCDPLAGWSWPQVLNSNAFNDGNAFDQHPALAHDGAGHWVVPWWRINTLGDDEYGTDPDVLSVRFELGRLGDFDFDGDVDLADFSQFANCYAGSLNPPAPSCPDGVNADFDGDGDVDLADFSSFAENFTGSQ